MEAWEYRYRHERAVRNATMLMHGMTPPVDRYGSLTRAPKICYLRFIGAKFWAAFNVEDGGIHTHTSFEECACRKK